MALHNPIDAFIEAAFYGAAQHLHCDKKRAKACAQ